MLEFLHQIGQIDIRWGIWWDDTPAAEVSKEFPSSSASISVLDAMVATSFHARAARQVLDETADCRVIQVRDGNVFGLHPRSEMSSCPQVSAHR
jgi:hypothetical protein